MAERLSALELIDLVLDEGSWTSWDTPPERGPVSDAFSMMPRPSRSHWTAAPVTKIEPSSA